jgi:hypothetical protein
MTAKAKKASFRASATGKLTKDVSGQLHCGRCGKSKFAGLFNESQRQKQVSDVARRCMECQKTQSTEMRRRFTPKTKPGDNWRGNNALFLDGSSRR